MIQRFHEFRFPLSKLPSSNGQSGAEATGDQSPPASNSQFHFAMYRGEESTLVGFSTIEMDDLDTIVRAVTPVDSCCATCID